MILGRGKSILSPEVVREWVKSREDMHENALRQEEVDFSINFGDVAMAWKMT